MKIKTKWESYKESPKVDNSEDHYILFTKMMSKPISERIEKDIVINKK